jgi:Glyoxalase-like domain
VLAVDHVVLAVSDLDASANRLLEEHGLASVPGGRHPAWGTGNRIVPLGETYIELLAVVDHDLASATDVGRFLESFTADGDRWFAVSLADDGLDVTAARLGLRVVTGERQRPDGDTVRWRSCGFEDDPERAARLPFFIEWDVPADLHPGRASAGHLTYPIGITRIEMGDDGRLGGWLGPEGRALPIVVVDGEPGLHRIVLATTDGDELAL